jgi:hypothetical protein
MQIQKMNLIIKVLLITSISLLSIFLMPCSSTATLIGLDLIVPDITSNSTGKYSYDAGTNLFSSTATPFIITFDGINFTPITGGSYSAKFYVDESGNFAGGVGGYDLIISGFFSYGGKDYSGTLIAGEVTNFGWLNIPGPYAIFDFSFDATGGTLIDFYGGGKGGDVLTSESSTFTGNWNKSHSGTKVKHDTAPLPEPDTILLFGLGIVGIAVFGRRKRGK